MFSWFRKKTCRHEFDTSDLKLTGISEPEEPDKYASYKEWVKYFHELHHGPSHTERVEWPCNKCGKPFRAHCGLDIAPRKGKIIR